MNTTQTAPHPGEKPTELAAIRDSFFRDLDALFPGKRIIWKNWDHRRLDGRANYLLGALGYSRGADLLLAHGYTLVTEKGVIAPQGTAEAKPAPKQPTAETAPKQPAAEAKPVPAKPAAEAKPAPQTSAAEPAPKKTAPGRPEEETRSGKIVTLLPNKNSGFVRDDADGCDYYFNVRSFRSWAAGLKPGQPVKYRLKDAMDQRKKQMRKTAVDLYFYRPEKAAGGR